MSILRWRDGIEAGVLIVNVLMSQARKTRQEAKQQQREAGVFKLSVARQDRYDTNPSIQPSRSPAQNSPLLITRPYTVRFR